MTEKLAADTSMGPVTLQVGDLDGMIRYYRTAIALDLIDQNGSRAVLGRGRTPLVIFEYAPELKRAAPGQAGLFHTAILFDTEAALAAAVFAAATHAPGTFVGSSDHLVSKAFYFTDPEGNGIELYWDRDRTQWSWTHGQVEMDTIFLDPNDFLREHLDEAGIETPNAAPATVGHVHLSVGDVATARDFYVGQLGFDATSDLGTALFVSAGGYHHHMAMNVWNSRGAGRRQPTLGLGRVDIQVPTADNLGEIEERMRHYRRPVANDGRSLRVEDPWANSLLISAA